MNEVIDNISSYNDIFEAKWTQEEKILHLQANLNTIKDYNIRLQKERSRQNNTKVTYQICDTSGDDPNNPITGMFFLRVSIPTINFSICSSHIEYYKF